MLRLSEYIPAPLQRFRRLPVSRDQAMLLMVAVNELFLGLDTLLAHQTSGTIVPREWIPIVFGFTSGLLLLAAGLLAIRNRPLATVIGTLTLVASIVVGVLGAYYHVRRATLPGAPFGEQLTVNLLIWAPPVMGPLAFALVGFLGISAAWVEKPVNSGTLLLLGGRKLHLPYSKTRAYLYMVGMGMLAALVSSVLDHARSGFHSPWIWFATAVGIFGLVAPVVLAALDEPTPLDFYTYIGAMVLLLVSGLLGASLHALSNLVAGNTIVIERFLRGAPLLAPMLYANMGLLGLLALLDPQEHPGESK